MVISVSTPYTLTKRMYCQFKVSRTREIIINAIINAKLTLPTSPAKTLAFFRTLKKPKTIKLIAVYSSNDSSTKEICELM